MQLTSTEAGKGRRARQKAALLAVLACALFAGGLGALVKAIDAVETGSRLHPLQVVHCRFLFGFLVVCFLLALRRSDSFRSSRLSIHLLRACCGVGALALMFYAITQLPLADVTAIVFANPLFTLVFCVLALGEGVGLRRWSAVAIGFLGVLLIAQPSSEVFQPAVVFAVLAAVVMGIDIGLIRLLTYYDQPMTALFVNNGLCMLLSAPLAVLVWEWPSLQQWLLLISVGVTVVVGQVALLRAITISQASFVAPFLYGTLVFGALYGYLFFSEVPDLLSLAGAALIVGSGLYLSLRASEAKPKSRRLTYGPARPARPARSPAADLSAASKTACD